MPKAPIFIPEKKSAIMKFLNIFKDSNDVNEKSVVGFISFMILIIVAALDIIFSSKGKPLVLNEFIYNAFIWITIGSFGVSGAEKIFKKKSNYNYNDADSNNYRSPDNEIG